MHQLTNENLILRTVSYFTFRKGKRVCMDEPIAWDEKNDTWFKFEATLFPPLMLLPITWRRYNYTLDDVYTTCLKRETAYMWQLALMLCYEKEPETAPAGVKATFQSLFMFSFANRKNVEDMIVSEAKAEHCSMRRTGSILAHCRADHVPLLPKVRVPQADFDAAAAMVSARQPSFLYSTCYPTSYLFKDVQLIPIEVDLKENLVYMVRVVKKRTWDTLPVAPKMCAVTLPTIVYIKDEPPNAGDPFEAEHGGAYVLLEEACFITVDSPYVRSSLSSALEGADAHSYEAPKKRRKT